MVESSHAIGANLSGDGGVVLTEREYGLWELLAKDFGKTVKTDYLAGELGISWESVMVKKYRMDLRLGEGAIWVASGIGIGLKQKLINPKTFEGFVDTKRVATPWFEVRGRPECLSKREYDLVRVLYSGGEMKSYEAAAALGYGESLPMYQTALNTLVCKLRQRLWPDSTIKEMPLVRDASREVIHLIL